MSDGSVPAGFRPLVYRVRLLFSGLRRRPSAGWFSRNKRPLEDKIDVLTEYLEQFIMVNAQEEGKVALKPLFCCLQGAN